jgi:kumamolisin
MGQQQPIRRPLKGSERELLPGAKTVGKADPAETLEVYVLLRRRTDSIRKPATRESVGNHLSGEQFGEQLGADATDIATIRKFANAYGLAVVQEHAGNRTVVLSGAVAQLNAAFGVDLQRFKHGEHSYRGRIGAVQLSDELHDVVEAVLGLDGRPAARPRSHAHLQPGNIRRAPPRASS